MDTGTIANLSRRTTDASSLDDETLWEPYKYMGTEQNQGLLPSYAFRPIRSDLTHTIEEETVEKMNRLGLIHPDTLAGRSNAGARAIYRLLSDFTDHTYGTAFTTKLPMTGALVGYPAIFVHSPELGRAFVQFLMALHSLPGLTHRVREIAILTVAVHEDAIYQIYAHHRLAISRGLLTSPEIQDILASNCPRTFDEVDTIAFEATKELCATRGSFPLQSWATTANLLGTDGALSLVHHVGTYRYIATLLNGFDARIPAEGERIENT